MKKWVPLLILVLTMAACNKNKEKIYSQALKGEWRIYKYDLYQFDATPWFESVYQDYRISFTDNGHFVETYTFTDTTTHTGTPVVIAGTYTFKKNDQVLALIDTVPVFSDSVWIPSLHERDYTLFNLVSNHVELFTDTSTSYLSKIDTL